MKIVKATTVLPEELLKEIQKYVQGETIYIPKPRSSYKKWGESSGGRKLIDKRNRQIRAMFNAGMNIEQLSELHHLSIETIKKIVYVKKENGKKNE